MNVSVYLTFVYPGSDDHFTAYITASFYFKKQQGISHEEFYRHWSTIHANMAISCKPFTVSFRRYVQVRIMHKTCITCLAHVEGM
ncbi:hypothetical protein BDV12DRAFT_178646, partial [Aspergillus spectabilis]